MSDESAKKEKAEGIAVKLGLKGTSKDSFVELCVKGCDPNHLGTYLYFLVSDSTVKVPRKHTPSNRIAATPEHYKRMKKKYFRVELRPLDSSDILNGFERRDLERLSDQLIKLANKLNKLHSTKLIRMMVFDEEFHKETQLFSLPQDLMTYSQIIIPHILKKLDSIGSKQRPEYTQYLAELYTHIHERTGKWHDSKVADILNALAPEREEGFETQPSLRQWRYRHGLMTKR